MYVAESYWFDWFFDLWTFQHRFHVGTMLPVYDLNVKKQNICHTEYEIAQMQSFFFFEGLLMHLSTIISYQGVLNPCSARTLSHLDTGWKYI